MARDDRARLSRRRIEVHRQLHPGALGPCAFLASVPVTGAVLLGAAGPFTAPPLECLPRIRKLRPGRGQRKSVGCLTHLGMRRFESLAYRSGLPAIRFRDRRHGAGSLSKAARQDTKIISELLGHHRPSFTDDAYVHVLPDVAKEAAEARAAVIPGRPKAG